MGKNGARLLQTRTKKSTAKKKSRKISSISNLDNHTEVATLEDLCNALGTELSLDLDALDLESRLKNRAKSQRAKSKMSEWAERKSKRKSNRSRTGSFKETQSMVDVNSRLLVETERRNSRRISNVSNQSILPETKNSTFSKTYSTSNLLSVDHISKIL